MPRKGTPLINWCNESGYRGQEVYNGFMLSKDKNELENIDIKSVSCASHKKAYFTCVKGHEFSLRLDSVKLGQWCPICAKETRIHTREKNQIENGSKETLLNWCNSNGEFGKIVYEGFKRCEELNNENNIFIETILSGSAKKVDFICDYGHHFKTTLSSIHAQHSWCKQCYEDNKGKILKEKSNLTRIQKGTLSLSKWCDLNGDIGKEIKDGFLRCKELNNKLGIDIEKVTIKSNQKAYFKCHIDSHEIQIKTIANVTRHNSFCSQCRYIKSSDKLVSIAVENGSESFYDFCISHGDMGKNILEAFYRCKDINSNIDIHKVAAHSNKIKAYFQCNNINHKPFYINLNEISSGTWCPYCAKHTSFPEQIIYLWCRQNVKKVSNMDRTLGAEADVLIEDIKLIIEYQGYYYHKDRREHDKEKRKYFESLGYQVLEILDMPNTECFINDNIVYNYQKDKNCVKLINLISEYLIMNGVELKCKNLSKDIMFKARAIMSKV